MKTIILIFTIATISLNTTHLSAQNIGIRAGADFATAKAKIYGLSVSNNETGFYVGLFTNFKVSESFKIRPEVNYIKIDDLDQIEIPLLMSIALADKFDVLAGPSFGFLLDSEDDSKSFNFGLDFGLSYDILENLLIDVRYGLGISNLADRRFYSDSSLKLSGFFIGLGYLF